MKAFEIVPAPNPFGLVAAIAYKGGKATVSVTLLHRRGVAYGYEEASAENIVATANALLATIAKCSCGALIAGKLGRKQQTQCFHCQRAGSKP